MKQSLCALSLVVGLSVAPFLSHAAPATKPAQPKPAPATAAPKTPAKETKPAATQQKGIIDTSYREVPSLSLLKDSPKWVGEKVSFEGTFVTFSPYALDYNGAMRTSKDYISFLVQRPDVTHHVIPMSELKLVYPRKQVDKVMDLESGDKIVVRGKVFSAALGDPWVDVDEVVILQKSPENLKKDKKKKNDLE